MTTSRDELLVMQVQANPMLWDSTAKDYRNKAKRTAVWQEIGRRLNRAGNECHLRWKYLRERYNKELKKKQTNPSGSGKDSEQDWELFTLLSFLSDVIKPRIKTSRNVQQAVLETDGGKTPALYILYVDSLPNGLPPQDDELVYEAPPPPSIQEIVDDVTSAYSSSSTPDQPQQRDTLSNVQHAVLESDGGDTAVQVILNDDSLSKSFPHQNGEIILKAPPPPSIQEKIKEDVTSVYSSSSTPDQPPTNSLEDWIKVESGPTKSTTSKDELLVREVRANPILWDTTVKDHRNKVKRGAVWQEIGRRLKRPGQECELRWKSLRERYNREFKKKYTKPSGSGKDSELEWELFTILSFLSDVIKPRRNTLSNVQRAAMESDGGDTPVQVILDVDSLPNGFPPQDVEIILEAPKPLSIQEIMEDVTIVHSYASTPNQPPTIRNLDNLEDRIEVESGPTKRTISNDELLVIEVQANPILWDTTVKDYRNKEKRVAVWQEIGRRLQREGKGCQLRWKYLRERYNKEFKKKITEPNGSRKDSELEWELFSILSFLNDVIKPRRNTLRNAQQAVLESDGGDTPVECILDVDSLPDGIPPQEGEVVLEVPPIQVVMEDLTSVSSYSSTPDQPRNKRRRHLNDNQVTTRMADEMASSRKSMEAMTRILCRYFGTNINHEPPHPHRLNALCSIISSRYADLTEELVHEFEEIVINAINMLHQRLNK